MTFQSILFERPDKDSSREVLEAPPFFGDLHLDQIVEAITTGWKDYNLAPFFYARLNDLDAIAYRQEIMRELEDRVLVEEINAFSRQMRMMRERLEQTKKFDDYNYDGPQFGTCEAKPPHQFSTPASGLSFNGSIRESNVLQVRILEDRRIFQPVSERAIKSDMGEPDERVRNPPRPAEDERSTEQR
ncbi:MAG: hypothetical protein WBL50_14260 [Candidatus Acidiferrum sp.]